MSDNHQFFPSQNPHPDIAIPTPDGYFEIPYFCDVPVKVEEEEYQEMMFEKPDHEGNHNQETEASILKIEEMLLEEGLDQMTIREILGSRDSLPEEFVRERNQSQNYFRVKFEEEEKEEGFFKRQENYEEDENEAKNIALIKELQEQDDQAMKDYMMALKMQQEEEGNMRVGLAKLGRGNSRRLTRAEGNCPICLDAIPVEVLASIEACEHSYHIECLEAHIVTEIDKNVFPIKCPFPECKAVLNENDVKDSLQTKPDYQIKYDQLSIRTHIDRNPNEYYQCPTPDCKFVCNLLGIKFDCLFCRKSYCKDCKTEWHEKMSCVQYQEQKEKQSDQAFEKYAQDEKYMKCPQCQVMVSRIDGCNAMVCSRCQTQFCYTCGKRGDGHNCTHCGNKKV